MDLTLKLLSAIAQRRPLILGYHGVDRASRADDLFRLQVAPDVFERQIESMLTAGFRFLTLSELARRLAETHRPEPGLAALTFDDGMRNNLTEALPITRSLGVPATVYVAVGMIGGQSPWVGGPTGAMLTSDEIIELHDAGWEIGAHTVSHPDMSRLSYDSCLYEARESREALETLTASRVTTFAYPFGRYGENALAATGAAGFEAAVTTGSGTWAPLELTRAMVSPGDPAVLTLLKLLDLYEPMLASPALRTVRTVTRRARSALAARRAA